MLDKFVGPLGSDLCEVYCTFWWSEYSVERKPGLGPVFTGAHFTTYISFIDQIETGIYYLY